MAQLLLFAGAVPFLMLGASHVILALRDLSLPRTFAPTDEGVCRAMRKSVVAMSPHSNLWDAWMGFNLSHGLGLVLFGGGIIIVAWRHFSVFAQSPFMQAATLVVAAAYLVIAARFFFRDPRSGRRSASLVFRSRPSCCTRHDPDQRREENLMRRLSGPLLMATGVLHLLAGFVFYPEPLAAIMQDGFFNAVELNPAQFDREAAFWWMVFGGMLLIFGGLVHWAQARTGTLPAFLGWALLALGVVGVSLMPASGFWLTFPQAALVFAAARWGGSRSAVAEAGPGVSTIGPGDHAAHTSQERRT